MPTVYTSLNVVNQALAMIGEGPIVALAGTDQKSVYCNTFYDQVRIELLLRYPWQFAVKVDDLSLTGGTETDEQWEYVYDVPTDMLKPLMLGNDPTVEFELRAGLLYTDYTADTVNLLYVYDVSTVDNWDRMFWKAIVYELAARLALPITGNATLQNNMIQAARMAFNEATAVHSGMSRKTLAQTRTLADSRF